MSEDALIVITSAIKTAFIDHPRSWARHGVRPSHEKWRRKYSSRQGCAGCSSPSRIFRHQGRGPECPEAL